MSGLIQNNKSAYRRENYLRWLEKLKSDPVRLESYRKKHRDYKRLHPWNNPERAKENGRRRRALNPDKIKAYRRAWVAANREKVRAQFRAWDKRNPEKKKAMQQAARKKPGCRLAAALRSRMGFKVIDSQGRLASIYKSEMIGCSPKELAAKFESQFSDGMSWENYGKVWVIDHVRPVCSFNLAMPGQMAACCHWSNLRPLLAIHNRSKGAKWEPAA